MEKEKKIVDQLGVAGSEYRRKIYKQGFNDEKQEISAGMIIEFAIYAFLLLIVQLIIIKERIVSIIHIIFYIFLKMN